MQTILGANGQIAIELARELNRAHTSDLRLVSRNPQPVNEAEALVRADLLDAAQTSAAVAGSDVVYFTAGFPADAELWERQFPSMLRNALDATRAVGARFAYFDNTYMYPQDDRVQTEETPFAPVGRKGRVAHSELHQHARDRQDQGRREGPRPGARRQAAHPLWTPDASRGLAALGSAEDAFGQTWHLPVDENRLTYREFVALAAGVFDTRPDHSVVPQWVLSAAGLFSAQAREIRELLPRYRHGNRFDSSKFTTRFPEFAVTRYREGLEQIRDESDGR